MVEIKLNEVWDPEHSIAIEHDNYNISRTRDETINNMHHIHNSCEILFAEEGAAYYYMAKRTYLVEAGDILIIGAMEHHKRVIDRLPFQRYGLTIKPSYYKSLMLENDLISIFSTPSLEDYNMHFKKVDPEIFDILILLLRSLKGELNGYMPFRSHFERTLITQIAIILFRISGMKQRDIPLTAASARMLDVKEYIDKHYQDVLDLKALSKKFFLHPATISKDFHKYCGYGLNKYINMVRISEAVKLLESNSDSISAIAEKCGYDSDNTFLRQFKQIMEISPSQYRKSFQNLCKLYRSTNQDK